MIPRIQILIHAENICRIVRVNLLNFFHMQVEIILIIKPYTAKLTKSEFHTVLVGSHASIAGFAYAIFVWFGVNPQHLLTAAVMSAPAAVAISKLNFPETEESYYKDESVIRFNKRFVQRVGSRIPWEHPERTSLISALFDLRMNCPSTMWDGSDIPWFSNRLGLQHLPCRKSVKIRVIP